MTESHAPDLLDVDDVLALLTLTDPQITPDGRLIAFVVQDSWKEKGKRVKSRIWVVPAGDEGGEARPFSAGTQADTLPRWSPDGTRLAFLSNRLDASRDQVYLMPRDGGEAEALTQVEGDIEWLAWSPDGRRLALLLTDAETPAERGRRDAGDDPSEVERHHKFTRLWQLDVATRELRCVTTADQQVWDAAWSPDGAQFALIVSAEPYEWSWYQAKLARVPAAGGTPEVVVDPAPRQIGTPVWSPDSTRIAYLSSSWSDRGAEGGDLYVVPAAGGAAVNLSADYRGSVRWMEWQPDGQALLALASEDARTALSRITLAGTREPVWSGPVAFSERRQPSFSSAGAGERLAVVSEALDRPREVWLGVREPGGGYAGGGYAGGYAWRQLTRLNAHVTGWAAGAAEELRWQGPDGLGLQGFLIRPVGHAPGRPDALITIAHGGPSALYDFRFAPSVMNGLAGLLAARGYAVFLPNPRGSFGWGTAFSEANLGDMGGRDMEDILAGIDQLVAAGDADPERLGIAGWSYGGFMSAWLITQTARFRAALVGAGITNWLSFHGTSTLSSWDQLYYRDDPYARGGLYEHFSPLTHVANARTPALILHGERDSVVPSGQAYELFRALKERGVPVELVVYPREGHGIVERAHRRHLLETVLSWFERYVPARAPLEPAGAELAAG
jgi:dipeptidyl aminopeptidase/acylaminoacyl peptidase